MQFSGLKPQRAEGLVLTVVCGEGVTNRLVRSLYVSGQNCELIEQVGECARFLPAFQRVDRRSLRAYRFCALGRRDRRPF